MLPKGMRHTPGVSVSSTSVWRTLYEGQLRSDRVVLDARRKGVSSAFSRANVRDAGASAPAEAPGGRRSNESKRPPSRAVAAPPAAPPVAARIVRSRCLAAPLRCVTVMDRSSDPSVAAPMAGPSAGTAATPARDVAAAATTATSAPTTVER